MRTVSFRFICDSSDIYKTDSERQLPTSYLWLMLTFALSRTVSELYAILVIFYVTGSDVTPISPLGGVAGQILCWILKGSDRFPVSD